MMFRALLQLALLAAASLDNVDGYKCLKVSKSLDIDQALHGYSPFHANPLSPYNDPGYSHGSIFDRFCDASTDQNRDTIGILNFITVYGDVNCDSSMTTKTYRSVKSFEKEVTSSFSFSAGKSFEAEASYKGFTASASNKFEMSRNTETSHIYKSFSEQKSSVTTAKAKCITHAYSLSPFMRPKFSANFIAGLNTVQGVLNRPESEQLPVYKEFIRQFGVYYIKQSFFGSSLLYEKAFQSKTMSETEEKSRKDCFGASVEACLGAGIGNDKMGASAKSCVNTKMESCSKTRSVTFSQNDTSTSTIRISSRGSYPKSLSAWASQDNMAPGPMTNKLERIENLMTSKNLAISATHGITTSLNADGIKAFLTKWNTKYCTTVLRLSATDCAKKLTGCSIAGDCPFGQRCIDDAARPNGFRCASYKIVLKTWKGDYLHRPDSSQGVTTWYRVNSNIWTIVPVTGNTFKLKSWKGDCLHRPNSVQGVTTWTCSSGGNVWTVSGGELVEGAKVQLTSWKGDSLHRPNSNQGITTWHYGAGGNTFTVQEMPKPPRNDACLRVGNCPSGQRCVVDASRSQGFRCTSYKIMLRSYNNDYLHRPDSSQGVTTWPGEISSNIWTVMFNEDGRTIKLRSWKGDCLHRPNSNQGVTSWWCGAKDDVSNSWTVLGGDLVNGARIELMSWRGDGLHQPHNWNHGVTTWYVGSGGNHFTVKEV